MMLGGEMTWADDLIPMMGPEAVTDIIARVSDVALVVSASGDVVRVLSNPEFSASRYMTGWEGKPFHDTLTIESIGKFDAQLTHFRAGKGNTLPVELNHSATEDHSEMPMRYSFHRLGKQGDILMLGHDLRSVSDMQQQLVAAQIALENDYEVQREHDIRFRVLLESSDTPTVLASMKTGNVVACNTAAEKLFGKPRDILMDNNFAREFDQTGHSDLLERLVSAASDQAASPVAAKALNGGRRLSLTPVLFRGANGQMLLCKIRTAGKSEGISDPLQARVSELYRNGVDAIVFVDGAGNILSANDAFPRLADLNHATMVQGRSIADFFLRGSVDLNVMLENARRTGSMRLYATKLVSQHGTERAVEISTTQLTAGGHAIFGLVIRDTRRVEAGRGPTRAITDVDMQSVIELIGGQSLKDIVAKTTDVVEKMCIETAVEMTSNNRVAAAEMLGLSRQSLYVKLRKYGLVSKN